MKRTTLALVDDHRLFRKGLMSLIDLINDEYEILFEADNGLDLQTKIDPHNPPDIYLMDVNMPDMDGFATVNWLREHFPLSKVLVVSMIENEEIIVKMLKLGVKGYLCKDVEPQILAEALRAIKNKGFYYTDYITGKLVHSLQFPETNGSSLSTVQITEKERTFLKLACSEMTYNEIAGKMFLSPKTIDGYRNSLFEKLEVKSRVGLVLFAIKNGYVDLGLDSK